MAGPSIVQQCLAAGLLDEIWLDLVPVLLGEGIRYLDHRGSEPLLVDDPEVNPGTRVTHLRYRIRS